MKIYVLILGAVHATNNADKCVFPNKPRVPYYWDENCKLGDLGCWADGLHEECRFCGDVPYITECPEDAKMPKYKTCYFPVPPVTEYYWEPKCKLNAAERVDKGCKADGRHRECRFCGSGAYADVPCPVQRCAFSAEPTFHTSGIPPAKSERKDATQMEFMWNAAFVMPNRSWMFHAHQKYGHPTPLMSATFHRAQGRVTTGTTIAS